MAEFDYSLNYKELDLREHPELYKVGKGEQGVLLVEPYKSEILPHRRFRTPEIAQESSTKIYEMFLQYKKTGDFVGMDMARKFLQMGWTRSRRYANHASGKKYSTVDKPKSKEIKKDDIPQYFDPRNQQHFIKTKTKKILPQEKDALTNEKAQSARIFYNTYKQANEDPTYKGLKKQRKEKYG